jgi:hypothetical protein
LIGRLPLSNPKPTAAACPQRGVTMKHVRTIAHLPNLPEIQIFYCAPCEHVETIKLKRAA